MIFMLRRGSSQAAPRLNRVYAAIADPTRRAILGVLARGELNVGSLAGRFPISFNGVSKHVKVLERAGLVRRRVRGREHWLRPRPEPQPVLAPADTGEIGRGNASTPVTAKHRISTSA